MKTKRDIRFTAFRVGALVLFAGATGGVVAEEAATRDMVRQAETVQYRPSHAETAAGAEKLYSKLERAAARVCKMPGRVFEGAAYASCISEALAKAVKDVDIDAVAAIYVEKNKLADRHGTVTVAKR